MEKDIISYASKAIEETTLRLEALLRGGLLLVKNVEVGEDLVKGLRDLCKEKLCFARISSRDLEGSLLVVRGLLVAAYAALSGEGLSGLEALEQIVKLVSKSGGSIIVYELSEQTFNRNYADVARKIEEYRMTQQKPVTPRIPGEELFGVQIQLLNYLRTQEVSLTSLVLQPKNGDVRVDADCVGKSCYPLHVVLAVVKELVERGLGFKKIELEMKMRDRVGGKILETSRTALTTDNALMWRSFAAISQICAKHGFLVENLEYKLRRDTLKLDLDVVVPYGRASQLSSTNYNTIPRRVAEDVFRKVSEIWRGKVEVKVTASISTLQGYIEYEEKFP